MGLFISLLVISGLHRSAVSAGLLNGRNLSKSISCFSDEMQQVSTVTVIKVFSWQIMVGLYCKWTKLIVRCFADQKQYVISIQKNYLKNYFFDCQGLECQKNQDLKSSDLSFTLG